MRAAPSEASPHPEPNWDMTPYFPEFAGRQYDEFRQALRMDVARLLAEVEALGPLDRSSAAAAGWTSLLQRLEAVTARTAHLASYLGCISAADSRDEAIRGEVASASRARAELEKIFVAVRAALGAADEASFSEIGSSSELRDVAYYVGRLRKAASFRMEAPLESLATDLGVDGLSAWGRLYNQVSGRLEFELAVPGRKAETLPVSVTRSLLEDPDAEVRRAALHGSNAAWEGVGDVMAAALNAIAGTRHALYGRRGVGHFLDPALFDASITRETLDAILGAAAARSDVPRRYLARKARLLGRDDGRLGFQDLMAPLPIEDAARIPWLEARDRIIAAFERFYPALAVFAKQAFDQRWIDYEPRAGKRPGGFCSTSPLIGQSRIFVTYNGTLGDLATVAHELGHAFHGSLLRDMRPWARHYPMTLAETASTFAEQLVIDAVLEEGGATPEQRAAMLDRRMQDGSTFLLNIPMRFRFEHDFYEERERGEVSVSRLCELMGEAQREVYGDCLAPDEIDPWFWASKLHFYITGLSFYNFPYTFGYLFSMGIFARAKQEGPSFFERYEALLRMTGSDTAEGVARRCLDVDLEAPDFWHASIDLIESDLPRFEAAAESLF
jgi:oligoendopeptidase F